jgi:hypothetical protein
MWAVSGPNESNGRADLSQDDQGVLANLPRTRPQRSSPRRAAARRATAGTGATQTTPKPSPRPRREPAASASPKGRPKAKAELKPKTKAEVKAKAEVKPKAEVKARAEAKAAQRPATPKPAKRSYAKTSARAAEPVPRQGFASEEERATGAVAPPGGAEFVNTAAEIFGELAKAGIAGGERLLRDVLSRFPR